MAKHQFYDSWDQVPRSRKFNGQTYQLHSIRHHMASPGIVETKADFKRRGYNVRAIKFYSYEDKRPKYRTSQKFLYVAFYVRKR